MFCLILFFLWSVIVQPMPLDFKVLEGSAGVSSHTQYKTGLQKYVKKKTLQKFDFVKVIFQSDWKRVPLPRGFISSGGDLYIFNYAYTTALNSWTFGGVDLMLCQMETQLINIPYLYLYTPPPNVQFPHWLHLWLQTMYMDLHLLFYFNTISWLPCFDRRLIMFSFSLLPFTPYPFPFFYLCQDWLD